MALTPRPHDLLRLTGSAALDAAHTCHQLFGAGQRVGPDLTAADRKNLDVLLQNVIDPSAVATRMGKRRAIRRDSNFGYEQSPGCSLAQARER